MRLVEVVQIEHEATIRTVEEAEIRQVRIATELDDDVRRRRRRQIRRHYCGSAAVERERAGAHPAVTDWHQFGEPQRILCRQDPDRVPAIGCLGNCSVGVERNVGSSLPSELSPGLALQRMGPTEQTCPLVVVHAPQSCTVLLGTGFRSSAWR